MFQKLLARRGLSFERLRALLDLAEAGSLIGAAGDCESRQAQYSRQIRELADYFGVNLTRRSGQRLELTEAGQRLVEIARETFVSLEDFQAECERRPVVVTIGGGDSLLQWLLLPQLCEIRRRLPPATIHLEDLSTADVVQGLRELRIDFGLLRESALVLPLSKSRLLRLTYSLFVPKTMLPANKTFGYRRLLQELPLALQASGGQFHQTLEQAARKRGIQLNASLQCVSFMQASRAVLTGQYAAILPSIAAADLDANRFAQLPLPLLKTYERVICLAWNPRLVRLRPQVEKMIPLLTQHLSPEKHG